MSLRVASAVIGAPILLLLMYLGGWPFFLTVALLFAVGAWELSGLHYRVTGRRTILLPVLVGGGLILAGAWHGGTPMFISLFAALVLASVPLFFRPAAPGDWADRVTDVAWTLMSVVYLGLLSFWLLVRAGEGGGYEIALFGVGVTWFNDTLAYFFGTFLSSRKLAPTLSPAKSWAGVLGGVVGGFLVGLGFARWWTEAPAGLPLVGIGLAVLAQLGDLFESMLKRAAGVKDAGSAIPGHGGVLDRFDSLLFVMPMLYLLCRIML